MNNNEQIIPISEDGQLVFTNWDMLTAISRKVLDSGITKLGNPAQINLIILKGKRLGLDLFEALENISVIGNKTCINGALASALVDRSGLLVDKTKSYEGEGDNRKCICTTQRKDRSKTTCEFSIKQARTAGLYPGRPGSGWNNYPDRMLYWRAMGFCFREDFNDVLQGMYLVEEMSDEVREINITPKAEVIDARKLSTNNDIPPEAKVVESSKRLSTKDDIPKKEVVIPFVPDPEDPKSHEHPIISAPSDIPNKMPIDTLRALAEASRVTDEELVKVINGLRQFPRGAEHKLESLPEEKILKLIKNWEVVLRNVDRIRDQKEQPA